MPQHVPEVDGDGHGPDSEQPRVHPPVLHALKESSTKRQGDDADVIATRAGPPPIRTTKRVCPRGIVGDVAAFVQVQYTRTQQTERDRDRNDTSGSEPVCR